MKRRYLIVGLLSACVLASTPQASQARWWRRHCGSYYGGFSYYPRYYSSYYPSYYSSYNSWSPYSAGYGSNCYGGYSPYSAYGYSPYYGYSQFGYSPYAGMAPGAGGGSLLGLLAGANLTGSAVKPQYLSMPVSMGYGRAGYLQLPVGSNSGHASYLQIPVNSGYGPSSYLQIELGRNAGDAAPAPSAAPSASPYGALPGANADAANRVTYDLPRTPSDGVPPVVPAAEQNPTSGIAADRPGAGSSLLPLTAEGRAKVTPTPVSSKFHLVTLSRTLESPEVASHTPAFVKDTSFSLIDVDASDAEPTKTSDRLGIAEEASVQSDGDLVPWVAK